MSDIMVRKKQKAAEKYSSAKLFISLYRALEHLPDAQNTAWHLLQTVELKLLQKTKDNMQISSTLIAKTCINSLKAFDHTAYIKYASHQPDIVKL